ncbi:MAG: AAA family ATPase [Eubacteriaceae bacterium]|nr:AAA family ATPase [Eubacteriaceae bacterium]
MENVHQDYEYEIQRLTETIALATKQLGLAKKSGEAARESILHAKKEVLENTAHSISNLYNPGNFENLVELSQYLNSIDVSLSEYEANGDKIAVLERIADSPYFARIDFTFEGEEEKEEVYIGRASLSDDTSYRIYVYDWRSPIASMFYRFASGDAYYDAPMGKINGVIGLKRQYEIKKGELVYFFDADVQVVDEFLRTLLSRNASTQMKSIVETIQMEQDTVIRDIENDLVMVQGVAGSGKTSIAMHRAAYLMYEGLAQRLSSHNIVIVSPSRLFEKYISNVLPELGESNVLPVVFSEMLEDILMGRKVQKRNEFLDELISDRNKSQVMKSAAAFKGSPGFVEMLIRFLNDMPGKLLSIKDAYYGGQLIASGQELRAQLAKNENAPLWLRLENVRESLTDAAEAIGKPANQEAMQQFQNSIRRFTQPNMEGLYKMLFSNEPYFMSLADGIDLPENIDEIIRYTHMNLEEGELRYDDASAIAFLALNANGAHIDSYSNIKQAVIDEAQDYYPLDYELFKLMFPYAKFTILGDVNQTFEKPEDISFYDQISHILDKRKTSLVVMDKSFRCTNQILAFSSKLVPQSLGIKSFNRDGDEPKAYCADNFEQMSELVAEAAKSAIASGFGTVGLICKTKKNAMEIYEAIKEKVDVRIIGQDAGIAINGVSLLPVYMSKGLEFDVVLVCDASDENYNTEDDKKLLYITSTRALHSLGLYSHGTLSRLVSFIDAT